MHLKTKFRPIGLTDVVVNRYLFYMALRVLLADESPTIKKVFQLSLQEFAVDVRSVNVGIDVVAVAEQFQPDIIFADVLLQKLSGYDVSKELKAHQSLQAIPVVLMWSGFMELDEGRFTESQADDKIEKPFDVDILREIVTRLVPKTKSQKLSQFLTYPDLPKDPKAAAPPKKPEGPPITEPSPPQQEATPKTDSQWNMDSFDNIDNYTGETAGAPPPFEDTENEDNNSGFEEFPLSESKSAELADEDEDSAWVQSNIRQLKPQNQDMSEDTPPVAFQVPDPPPDFGNAHPPLEFEIDSSEQDTNFNYVQPDNDLQVEEVVEPSYSPSIPEVGPAIPGFERKGKEPLTEKRVQEIVAAECEKIIKDMLKDVIPQLAREVIEAEIQKLLKEL